MTVSVIAIFASKLQKRPIRLPQAVKMTQHDYLLSLGSSWEANAGFPLSKSRKCNTEQPSANLFALRLLCIAEVVLQPACPGSLYNAGIHEGCLRRNTSRLTGGSLLSSRPTVRGQVDITKLLKSLDLKESWRHDAAATESALDVFPLV